VIDEVFADHYLDVVKAARRRIAPAAAHSWLKDWRGSQRKGTRALIGKIADPWNQGLGAARECVLLAPDAVVAPPCSPMWQHHVATETIWSGGRHRAEREVKGPFEVERLAPGVRALELLLAERRTHLVEAILAVAGVRFLPVFSGPV